MKSRFALLALVGAVIALAVPASSMASVFPAGAKFEITPSTAGPKLGTSLGSCAISKITGTIPASPANESTFNISTPAVGTCTAGTTLSVGGEWKLSAGWWNANIFVIGTETLVFRFSSLPGCKLAAGSNSLHAVWSNGYTGRNSTFYPDSRREFFKWANDGGTCALAGQSEWVNWESRTMFKSATGGSGEGWIPAPLEVKNLTNPSVPITLGG
jgi:hypothetical protein